MASWAPVWAHSRAARQLGAGLGAQPGRAPRVVDVMMGHHHPLQVFRPEAPAPHESEDGAVAADVARVDSDQTIRLLQQIGVGRAGARDGPDHAGGTSTSRISAPLGPPVTVSSGTSAIFAAPPSSTDPPSPGGTPAMVASPWTTKK